MSPGLFQSNGGNRQIRPNMSQGPFRSNGGDGQVRPNMTIDDHAARYSDDQSRSSCGKSRFSYEQLRSNHGIINGGNQMRAGI